MPRKPPAGKKKRPATKTTPKKKPLPGNWRDLFIESLAACGVVTAAAQAASVDRTYAYVVAAREPEFAARWDAAYQQATLVAQETLYVRAVGGLSDACLIFLLKSRLRAIYGDKAHLHLSGNVGLKAEDLADDDLAAVVLAGAGGGGAAEATPGAAES